MAQRRSNLSFALSNPGRSSRLLLALGLLAIVLVGVKGGAILAGRSSAIDRAVVSSTSPLAIGTKRGAESIGGVARWFQLPAIIDENERLKEDNAILLSRGGEVEGLRQENVELRKLLKLAAPPGFKAVHATVIARPFDPWLESAVLGVGRERGIVAGCAVVADGALIGKVAEAANGFSRVELLSSPRFKIAAVTDPAGYEGIVRGVSGSELALDYIRSGAKVEISTKVYTRGSPGNPAIALAALSRLEKAGLTRPQALEALGAAYDISPKEIVSADGFVASPPVPGNILIGTIVEKSSEHGFLELWLSPATDINRLSNVTVYVP